MTLKQQFTRSFAISGMFALITLSCNANQNANAAAQSGAGAGNKTVYDFTMNDIDGNAVPLSQYKGKVLVIVNTASQCGLVGQFAELESFYKKYQDKGVVVLGFPSNNFLGQEPLSNAEIKSFCTKNYGVTFPMFEKIEVKGSGIHPLYKYLTSIEENGKVDSPVKWNYQKFIIDKTGHVAASITPRTSVNDPEFLQALEDVMK